MSLTNRYYGGSSLGSGRTIQDFGLCDLTGNFTYTAKSRTKGLLVVAFFAPNSQPSTNVLKVIQQWTADIPGDKWAALAVAGPDRQTVGDYGKTVETSGITVLVDSDQYQTRNWGISHLPTVFLIDGKTGRILNKVIGDTADELGVVKDALTAEIAKIRAAEEAAKKADEEKKAAEAAAKAAAEQKAADEKKSEPARA